VLVHGLYPFIEKCPFGFILLRVLPFGFKDQVFTVLELDYKIRPILFYDSLKDIQYLKAKMVILNPRINYFFPLPHGYGSFLPIVIILLRYLRDLFAFILYNFLYGT